jgi:xanthine/uracil/vitamin C permease (AzgA family)
MFQPVKSNLRIEVLGGVTTFLTIIGIPLTYNISHGIGFGFVSREVSHLLYVFAALFAINFVIL